MRVSTSESLWQLNCLFNWLFRLASKETSKAFITDHFWGRDSSNEVDSPHKGPVIQNVFLCYDVIMLNAQMAWQSIHLNSEQRAADLIVRVDVYKRMVLY